MMKTFTVFHIFHESYTMINMFFDIISHRLTLYNKFTFYVHVSTYKGKPQNYSNIYQHFHLSLEAPQYAASISSFSKRGTS